MIVLFILMLAYNFFLKPRDVGEEDYFTIDTLLPGEKLLNQIPKGSDLYNSRVMRGGSWMDKESDCRLTNRDYMDPKVGTIVAGFRLVRRM